MPFPPSWPEYIPKDKLANWFESYADAMELNVWTGCEFNGATYDTENGQWSAQMRLSDGRKVTLNPKHIVLATSVSSIPKLPEIPTIENFRGKVIHASKYVGGKEYKGKSAFVFGTGTSGHDIAQDLASQGADATLVQRGSTMIINVEPGAQLPYSLYREGLALEDCDLITVATPFPVVREAHKTFTKIAREQDKELLDGLKARGMQLDFGIDDTGWQFKYLSRGGGYYFNVGASELVADGTVKLLQYSDIEKFVSTGVEQKNGSTLKADIIILATGYEGMNAMVKKFFGDDVEERIGPIWGFDDDGLELRNMFCRTAQTGLWFMGGSFAQCRIYSKYMALQIKAEVEGLL